MVLDRASIHFGFDSILVVLAIEKVDLQMHTVAVADLLAVGKSSAVELECTDTVEFAAVEPLGSVVRMATVEHCSVVDTAPAADASFAAEEQTMTFELVTVHRTNLRAVDPLAVVSHMRIDEQGFVGDLSVTAVVPFADD